MQIPSTHSLSWQNSSSKDNPDPAPVILARNLLNSYQDVPDQTAIHFLQANLPETEITYRMLFEGSASYAHALEAANVAPGEVVILILPHSEALVYAFWGAVLRGVIPSIMPFLTEKLSPEHYRAALAALFEITAPAAVVTCGEYLPDVQAAAGPVSSLRAILLSEQVQPAPGVDPASLPGLNRLPDDVVLLQHSSGTTGLQKGVALSHQAIMNQLSGYAGALHIDHQDVIVSWLPLYHDMGLIASFLLPILSRVPVVLMSPFDWVRAPFRLFTAVSHYRGTLVWLPNFAYNFCAQKVRDRELVDVDLTSLRAVINCSEPTYWKSHQLFLQRFGAYGLRPQALTTCYAMAETVFAVTQSGIDSPVVVDPVCQNALLAEGIARPARPDEVSIPMLSAGKPIAQTRVRVLDQQRQELPDRQVGEIAVQSNSLFNGYYNRPDLTANCFQDGWYLTGDFGYTCEGEVFVIGRMSELIIVAGKNVYPQDLEHLAGEVPDVHPGRVVAFGVFNEATGTQDVILVAELDDVQAEGGWEQAAARVANQIRASVTRGSDVTLRHVRMVPRGWLLKTSSGKIARRANRDKYLAERDLPHA